MSRLYDRVCQLLVQGGSGTLDLSDFRVVFEVSGTTTQKSTTAVIRIYNLSEATAQSLPRTGATVKLYCGYRNGDGGTVFTGNIVERHIGRENPTDTVAILYAADGDRAYTNAVVSKTLKAGSTGKDIYQACLDAMARYGIKQGYIPPEISQQKVPRAQAQFGMARDILRKMALAHGCTWKIQDDKLNVVPIGKALPGSAVVLNSSSGLIGRPVQTEQGIIVRSLLNPRLQINGTVQIDEKSIDRAAFNLSYAGAPLNAEPNLGSIATDGTYKIQALTQIGDTRGNPWYADMITNALGAITSSAIRQGLT